MLKPFLTILILAFVFSMGNTSINIFVSVMCTSLHWSYFFILSIPNIISILFMIYPCFIFIALALECFAVILDKCENLKYQKDHEILLKDSIRFLKHLDIIKRILSPNMFYVTTLYSLEIMVMIYVLIFQFMVTFDNMTLLLTFNFLVNSLFLFLLILVFNLVLE